MATPQTVTRSQGVQTKLLAEASSRGMEPSAMPAPPVSLSTVGAVRYIKLGERAKWAAGALRDGILPFGYRSIDHFACVHGDWDRVGQQLVAMGRTARGVGQ